jgi:predicted acyl esterase
MRLAIVLLTLCACVAAQPNDVNLLLSTLPAGKDPQRYKGYVAPQFKGVTQRALYLPMRDGVKIAVTLVLPKDLPADQKIPAIMSMTRYWRARQGGEPNAFIPAHGYAMVFVDARGTGASFGVWRAPFSQDEVKDYNEVANWIVTQPWSNGNIGAMGNSYTGDDSTFGATLDELSLHHYSVQIEKSGVAINDWGGWFDACTPEAIIKTFLTLKNYQRAVIGPWNHGASQNASPYLTPASQRVMLTYEWLRFFDHYLKGIDTGLDTQKRLFYFTIGEERWKATDTWPIAGTQTTRWYFNENNSLTTKAPDSKSTEDRYAINFEATTGAKNRWHTQVGGEVVYPDRVEEDKKLLTYTSAPLEADVEITGHPIVSLFVTSTHTDGAFFVYLEDVDENGKVTYLTEGELRALHRRISSAPSPTKLPIPYHTFLKKDALPLVPGQVAELKFGLQPVSVLVKKGHRLRVAIAGHDKDTFLRIPAEGTPTIAMQRNGRALSMIELPIIKR